MDTIAMRRRFYFYAGRRRQGKGQWWCMLLIWLLCGTTTATTTNRNTHLLLHPSASAEITNRFSSLLLKDQLENTRRIKRQRRQKSSIILPNLDAAPCWETILVRGGASASKKKRLQRSEKEENNSNNDSADDAAATESISSTGAISSQMRLTVLKLVRQIISKLLEWTSSVGILHWMIHSVVLWLEILCGASLLPSKKTTTTTKLKNIKARSKKSAKNEKQRKEMNNQNESEKDGMKTSTGRHKATKKNKKETTIRTSNRTMPSTSSKLSSSSSSSSSSKKINNSNYRIQRELKAFLQDPPDHLRVHVGKKHNIRVWIVTMDGLGIYQGETFQLRIAFPDSYPLRPPSVYFLPPHIPVHEHVYSNGDICLSLLGKDWRPTMTAQSIAHSILSILASASHKSKPMDNARHAHNKPGEYQEAWVYHDDSC